MTGTPRPIAGVRNRDLAWAILLFAVAIGSTLVDWDRRIAAAWAFDAALNGFPARSAFWATTVMHSGGRAFVWAVGLAHMLGLIAGADAARFPRLARERPRFVIAVVGIATTTLVIGLLKRLSHMDCPWDLAEFGGRLPYVELLQARPAGLDASGCFPSAHAGSGFALLSLHFAWRDTRWSRPCAAAALLAGASFGLAQQARGAHFVSHDLWSLAIAWLLCAAVAVGVRNSRLVRAGAASHAHGANDVATPRKRATPG